MKIKRGLESGMTQKEAALSVMQITDKFDQEASSLRPQDLTQVAGLIGHLYSSQRVLDGDHIWYFWSRLLFLSPSLEVMLKIGCAIIQKEGLEFFGRPLLKDHPIFEFFHGLFELSRGSSKEIEFDKFEKFCYLNLKEPNIIQFTIGCLRKWRTVNISAEQDLSKIIQTNRVIHRIMMRLYKSNQANLEKQIKSIYVEHTLIELFGNYEEINIKELQKSDANYLSSIILTFANKPISTGADMCSRLGFILNGIQALVDLRSEKLDLLLQILYMQVKNFTKKQSLEEDAAFKLLDVLDALKMIKYKFAGLSNNAVEPVMNIFYMLALLFFSSNTSVEFDFNLLKTNKTRLSSSQFFIEAELKLWFFTILFRSASKITENVTEIKPILEELIEDFERHFDNGELKHTAFHMIEGLSLSITANKFEQYYSTTLKKMRSLIDHYQESESLNDGSKLYFELLSAIRTIVEPSLSIEASFGQSLRRAEHITKLKQVLVSISSSVIQSDSVPEDLIDPSKQLFFKSSSLIDMLSVFDLLSSVHNLGRFEDESVICSYASKLIIVLVSQFKADLSNSQANIVLLWAATSIAEDFNSSRKKELNIWVEFSRRILDEFLSDEKSRRDMSRDELGIMAKCWLSLISLGQTSSNVNTPPHSEMRRFAEYISEQLAQNEGSFSSFLTFVEFKLLLVDYEKCAIERSKLLKELNHAFFCIQDKILEMKEMLEDEPLVFSIFPDGQNTLQKGISFYRLFLEKAVIRRNLIQYIEFSREGFNKIASLASDLRFKRTSCQILKNAKIHNERLGDFFGLVRSLTAKSFLMKYRFEEDSYEIKVLESLGYHLANIEEEIEKTNDIISCLKSLFTSLAQKYYFKLLLRTQKRYIEEFLFSVLLDVGAKTLNIPQLYYIESYRRQIIRSIDGFSFSNCLEIKNKEKAQELIHRLRKKCPEISSTLLEINTSETVLEKIVDESGELNLFINEIIDETPRLILLNAANELFKKTVSAIINRRDDSIQLHLSVDLLGQAMFRLFSSIGSLDGVRITSELILFNYSRMELIEETESLKTISSVTSTPLTLLNVINQSTNISYAIRSLVKEDYINIIQNSGKGPMTLESKKLKRMTVRYAHNLREFYKYSYYWRKIKQGDFKFTQSRRLCERFKKHPFANVVTIGLFEDFYCSSGDMKLAFYLRTTVDGKVFIVFDRKKVIEFYCNKFIEFELSIEKHLRDTFNDSKGKINKKEYNKTRRKKDADLLMLLDRLKEEIGVHLNLFTDLCLNNNISDYSHLPPILQNKEFISRVLSSPQPASSSSRSNLLLQGKLSQLPLEAVVPFPCPSRVESLMASLPRSSLCSDSGSFPRLYYILNPSGDFPSSERRLSALFKSGDSCVGAVGHYPPPHEVAQYLASGYCLVYCGHGDGKKAMNDDLLNRITNISGKVVALMGCASASLVHNLHVHRLRDVEHEAVVVGYLTSGAKGVFGNLWSVTERDSDQITKMIVQEAIRGNQDSFELGNIKK